VKRELSRGIVFFCALLSLPAFAGAGAPKAAFRDPSFDFGRAMHGSVVEHDFVLRNEGSAALRIVKAGMTPLEAIQAATIVPARAMKLDRESGTIEPGKRADLIIVDRSRLPIAPDPDPYSTLVYAARGPDVRTTIVGGDVLVDEFTPTRVDIAAVGADARNEARALAARAGL